MKYKLRRANSNSDSLVTTIPKWIVEKMNIRLKFMLRKTLLKVINSLEEENKQLKNKMKQKEHDNLILLDNSIELRRKIKDLENNIEFLVNNLSSIKKKKIGL